MGLFLKTGNHYSNIKISMFQFEWSISNEVLALVAFYNLFLNFPLFNSFGITNFSHSTNDSPFIPTLHKGIKN